MALLLAKRNLVVFSTTVIVAMNGHSIPDVLWLVPLLAAVLVCCRFEKLHLWNAVFLATVVSLVHAHQFVRQTNTLFNCAEDITINVRIESSFKSNLYFSTSLVALNGNNSCGQALGGKVLLQIKEGADQFRVGEVWRVKVRLKSIRGLMNGAGFDAETYYFSRGVIAKARVIEILERVETPSLRGRLLETFIQLTQQLEQQPALLALMFGDRALIEADTWSGLKQSGLAHLIAISGLHIGMAFSIGWWLGYLIRLVLRECFYAPFLGAITVALIYSWLAGFSLPTQRALTMCLCWALFKMLHIHITRWHLLCFVLAIILLFSPSSSLDPSLWLSVGAVAVLFMVSNWIKGGRGLWLNTVVIQLGLLVGLIPLSLMILGGFSAVSIIYNLIFIPFLAIAVVPLLFAGLVTMTFAPQLSASVFMLADRAMSVMMSAVSLSSAEFWLEDRIYLALAFTLIVPLLLRKSRYWAGCGLLLLTSSSYQTPPNWQLDILDVGHGLAVLVRRGEKALLYDTGASWDSGSIANQVIVPVLNQTRAELDTLIVSHWDNDHSGGVEALLDRYAPQYLFSSQLQSSFMPCLQGMRWWWQGLSIRFLWPKALVFRAYNPHSCVLEISDGVHKVLLTGDIELLSEYQLRDELAHVDVLVVPHHGSVTSSSPRFISLTSPKIAVASASSRGQWTFPSPDVRLRYEQIGSTWLDTAQSGRVQVRFFNQSIQLSAYRSRQSDAWYRQILRKGVE